MVRYIGLDVHKAYIRGYEFRPHCSEGKQERHFRFPNTPVGWSQFISGLDPDVQIALEVTGSAFEIHDILAPHAAQVVVSNPVAMRRLGSGRHTDREDAVRLAHMLALGTLPVVWVPPHPVREVRRLLEVRERLGSYRRALTNQARAVLRRHGILLPKGPTALRQVTEAVVCKLPQEEQAILASVLSAARALEEQENALTAHIASRVVEEPAVHLLMTIPGVGMLTAATIWAKLGDPIGFGAPSKWRGTQGWIRRWSSRGSGTDGGASVGTGIACCGGCWWKQRGQWPGTTVVPWGTSTAGKRSSWGRSERWWPSHASC